MPSTKPSPTPWTASQPPTSGPRPCFAPPRSFPRGRGARHNLPRIRIAGRVRHAVGALDEGPELYIGVERRRRGGRAAHVEAQDRPDGAAADRPRVDGALIEQGDAGLFKVGSLLTPCWVTPLKRPPCALKIGVVTKIAVGIDTVGRNRITLAMDLAQEGAEAPICVHLPRSVRPGISSADAVRAHSIAVETTNRQMRARRSNLRFQPDTGSARMFGATSFSSSVLRPAPATRSPSAFDGREPATEAEEGGEESPGSSRRR